MINDYSVSQSIKAVQGQNRSMENISCRAWSIIYIGWLMTGFPRMLNHARLFLQESYRPYVMLELEVPGMSLQFISNADS
jgi:hypothetical protein